MQLTDGTDWVRESLDNLLQECTTIAEGDTGKWNTTGNFTPPADIIGVICPNSCTDHGNCTEGKTLVMKTQKHANLI